MSDLLQRIVEVLISAFKQSIAQLKHNLLKAFQQIVKSEALLVSRLLLSNLYLRVYMPFRLRGMLERLNERQERLKRQALLRPLIAEFTPSKEAIQRTEKWYKRAFLTLKAEYEQRLKQLKMRRDAPLSEVLQVINLKIRLQQIDNILRVINAQYSTPLSLDTLDFLQAEDDLKALKAGIETSYENTLRALESEKIKHERKVAFCERTLQALKRKFKQEMNQELSMSMDKDRSYRVNSRIRIDRLKLLLQEIENTLRVIKAQYTITPSIDTTSLSEEEKRFKERDNK